MFRKRVGSVCFFLGSILALGCQDQGGTSSTTGATEQTDQASTTADASLPLTTFVETTMSLSSSSSVPTSSSSSTQETSSATSSSSEQTSSETTSAPGPVTRVLELLVPGHRKLLEEGAEHLRISVAPMGSASSDGALLDEAVTVTGEGKIVFEISEPAHDPDKVGKLQQFMVTLYRDKNENQEADVGDEFSATLLEFLIYRSDTEPNMRWRKFDPRSRRAVEIEGAITMVGVWARAPRIEALIGGKVSDVPKDLVSVALFSDVEKLDLKKNFSTAGRSLDEKIPRDKLFWEAKISRSMDRRRWADEKRPVLSGIGRHGLSWFSGYHTPSPTLIPTARRNSQLTDELCHSGQALVAIWIQESDRWITSMTGAFVVAYHDLAPGWNIVKIDRSPGKQVSFHQISRQDRYELTFSPVCGIRNASGVDISSVGPQFPKIDL